MGFNFHKQIVISVSSQFVFGFIVDGCTSHRILMLEMVFVSKRLILLFIYRISMDAVLANVHLALCYFALTHCLCALHSTQRYTLHQDCFREKELLL